MSQQLDIGKCFNDALEVYKVNVLMLIVSALLFQILSLLTLLILAGPLFGGYCLMTMNAMRRADKKIELNDMFKMFNKFGFLLGLFFLQGLAIFGGFLLLIIPGLLLSTMWLYSYFFMVDKDRDIIQAMKDSWYLVKEKGLWINFALCILYILLTGVSAQLPMIGWVLNLFAVPFAILMLTSGYFQQAEEQATTTENRPFADVKEEGQS